MKLFGAVYPALAVLLAGCGPAANERGAAPSERRSESDSYQGSSARNDLPGTRLRSARDDAQRAEFLNRIRKADPQFSTIQRALLNEQNELGIILNRDVDLNAVPALMRSLLTQMAREFPGQDLTVLAYAPGNPPRKIGSGRWNARTRDITYTPAR